MTQASLSPLTGIRAKTEPSWFNGTSIGHVHLRSTASSASANTVNSGCSQCSLEAFSSDSVDAWLSENAVSVKHHILTVVVLLCAMQGSQFLHFLHVQASFWSVSFHFHYKPFFISISSIQPSAPPSIISGSTHSRR